MKIDYLKVFSKHVVLFGRRGGLTHVEVMHALCSDSPRVEAVGRRLMNAMGGGWACDVQVLALKAEESKGGAGAGAAAAVNASHFRSCLSRTTVCAGCSNRGVTCVPLSVSYGRWRLKANRSWCPRGGPSRGRSPLTSPNLHRIA